MAREIEVLLKNSQCKLFIYGLCIQTMFLKQRTGEKYEKIITTQSLSPKIEYIFL